MFTWLRDPQNRVRAAMAMFWGCLVAWPLTHVLMIVTHPPELASWTGHLLLALSWWAMILTALNIVVTTDVRREQADNGDNGG